ncbi:BREX system P-loop protein BrxC [Planctomicrobium sp. SH527]|uniref:BREX system P-loop protein BrxC n=1 Tax=Planctomicrobium sp. SH527 TaxID=3448123 RepID=UPI003F5C0658
MKTIGDLISRPLDRKIEEIIQVDQADEQSVHAEISEYVGTDSIRDQYHHLLKAVAEAPADPHESVGVWVSGFFGSGKSSFAKNLGYALQNRTVLGTNFAELFKQQLGDERISDLLDLINAKTPTEVILFEVAKEADTRKVTQRIAELMYTVLLRELGYAEDFDIAELEIELEAEGKLPEFIAICKSELKKDWETVRAGAQKVSRASAILHKLDDKTHTTADSWAHTLRNRDASISVSKVVERTFELWGRRRPGKALVFIIDEVGQHVARSGDKIEDLRATIEEFGKVGKNLLKARKITAPCWIVVTSQEKLDEVVAAIDSKRIELAKLQDRFRYRVDLAPSDIREVATKRVLAKKTDAEKPLKDLFKKNEGQLNAALRLERTTRRTDISESDFIHFYPYPPHYIDLCIGIMSGIRLQPGAPRHYGGSNRTIIKQAYEMLVSDRTAFAKKPIGALVTLDKVFELVEGNLSNEKRTDIHQIAERFKSDPEDNGWALRVAKVICLLEFIRDLPRTEANLAAVLVDEVGKATPLSEVQAAVKRLDAAKFIRNTEEGWKLQTAQEKNWTNERSGHLDPKPRERNELTRTALQQIFDEPEFKTYRYQNRSFRIGISVDGASIGDEGELPLTLCVSDDADELTKRIEDIRTESQQKSHENDLYWLFCLTPEIDELVAQLHASRKMVDKYNQMSAQQKISPDEATCLQDEKNAKNGHENRLRDKLTEAMERGTGMFRGVQKDASALGKGLSEILKKLFGQVVPDLYPKLQMGSRPLKGDEAEQILKAVDLKVLPKVFYEGDQGLAMVVKDGAKLVININSEVCKEVLDYLKSEHSYGNKDTRMGKALEKRFGGTPYGWERDMLRLILATQFRAGEIEVTYQGNRFHNYQDPASRTPFTNNPAFRSSLYSPRQSVGLKTLTQAVQQLEDLTGEEVDVEEGAIATAFKKVAAEELEKLYPLKATAEAHRLPVLTMLSEFQQTLTGIQSSASDDCVRILTENGKEFGETRDKVRKLRESLDGEAISVLRQARQATDQVWNRLAAHNPSPELETTVEELKTLLTSEQFIDSWDDIAAHTKKVLGAYQTAYCDLFDRRKKSYESAIDEIQNRTEWAPLESTNPGMASTLLSPLQGRVGTDEDKEAVAEGKSLGKASLTEMESDLAAVDGLKSSVMVKLQELSIGSEKKAPVRKVRVSEFFNRPIQTQEELDKALDLIRDSLQKCIDEGAIIILE